MQQNIWLEVDIWFTSHFCEFIVFPFAQKKKKASLVAVRIKINLSPWLDSDPHHPSLPAMEVLFLQTSSRGFSCYTVLG